MDQLRPEGASRLVRGRKNCQMHDVLNFIDILKSWSNSDLLFVVDIVCKEKGFTRLLKVRLILSVFGCYWSKSHSTH